MQCSKTALLFDHVVCGLLENPRNIEAERLGSLEIDHQLVFYRGLHRQVGRLLALQDASGITANRAAELDSGSQVEFRLTPDRWPGSGRTR
jgi:hypothetical protein